VIAASNSSAVAATTGVIFSSANLQYGSHSLNLQLQNNGNLTLDYFRVQAINGNISTNGTQANGTGSPPSSNNTDSNGLTGASNPVKDQNKRSVTGRIVGGSLSAVLLVLLLIALFRYWKRRKLRRHATHWQASHDNTEERNSLAYPGKWKWQSGILLVYSYLNLESSRNLSSWGSESSPPSYVRSRGLEEAERAATTEKAE